jgi:hypothetical protein
MLVVSGAMKAYDLALSLRFGILPALFSPGPKDGLRKALAKGGEQVPREMVSEELFLRERAE